ncbi:hypothetical protein GCM10009646_21770 [Streptomyces aureus]
MRVEAAADIDRCSSGAISDPVNQLTNAMAATRSARATGVEPEPLLLDKPVSREPNGEPSTATPNGFQWTVADWFTHSTQVIGLSVNAQPEPPISPPLNPP